MGRHLEKIQRHALLQVSAALSTPPTSALQVIFGILPIDLKADVEFSSHF